MKTKSLLVFMVVVGILLLYSSICYRLLNEKTEEVTRNAISTFLSEHFPEVHSYEYLKAVGNGEDSFQVFVKTNEDKYYTFYFYLEDNIYQLINVSDSVPSYVL